LLIQNLRKVFLSLSGIMGILLGMSIILIPSYYFFDSQLIIGNLWYRFYLFEIILTSSIVILFGIFMGASFYKIHYFQASSSWAGAIGGFLWILVAGCPACSITIASYIGLAGIISIFPFYGLELKVISVFLLIYANFSILRQLELCKIKA